MRSSMHFRSCLLIEHGIGLGRGERLAALWAPDCGSGGRGLNGYARHGGQFSIFEIEPAASREAARSPASFFCEYFRSLGLDVVTGPH